MKLVYPAIFTPFSDELEGYTVTFPDIPGCVTEGHTLLEAIEIATDAASGWVLDEMEDGNEIPAASDHKSISCEDNSFINLIVLDMLSYSEKHGDKAVRRNVSLPAWLNTFGEKQEINFSKVLQEALIEMSQKDNR